MSIDDDLAFQSTRQPIHDLVLFPYLWESAPGKQSVSDDEMRVEQHLSLLTMIDSISEFSLGGVESWC